jgi:hypothetical protein
VPDKIVGKPGSAGKSETIIKFEILTDLSDMLIIAQCRYLDEVIVINSVTSHGVGCFVGANGTEWIESAGRVGIHQCGNYCGHPLTEA